MQQWIDQHPRLRGLPPLAALHHMNCLDNMAPNEFDAFLCARRSGSALDVHCCGRVRARQHSLWACLDSASVLRELATSTLRAPRRLFAATSYHALTAAPLHLPTDWPAAAARSATHLSQQPRPAILPSHRYVLLMEEKKSMPAAHACAPFFFLVLHVSPTHVSSSL